MANEEHLGILTEGVDVWNAWRKSNMGSPDLSGANLSGANLSGADLSGADLICANLNGADLSGADLNGALLNEADLSGANLRDADLGGANLPSADLRANLSGANLRNANLRYANLRGANLGGADLGGANLGLVNLRGAHLGDANLGGAELNETILGDVDLSATKGVSACVHYRPSTIDHRTLERSGKLPIEFLRGCGLPDTFIDYIPSLFGAGGIEFYSCFISHSNKDKEFARRLHDSLQGRGIRCWLDEKQIKTGDDIYEEIDRGIRLWDKIILCCSEKALTESWWVEEELKKALKKEQAIRKEERRKALTLLPVALDRHVFDGDYLPGLKDTILGRKVGNFTDWKDYDAFEAALDELALALRADEGRREPPPESKL